MKTSTFLETRPRGVRRVAVLTPVHWWLTLAGLTMTLLAIALAAIPR